MRNKRIIDFNLIFIIFLLFNLHFQYDNDETKREFIFLFSFFLFGKFNKYRNWKL